MSFLIKALNNLRQSITLGFKVKSFEETQQDVALCIYKNWKNVGQDFQQSIKKTIKEIEGVHRHG